MEERIGQQLPASLALLLVIPAEMLADRRTIELDPKMRQLAKVEPCP